MEPNVRGGEAPCDLLVTMGAASTCPYTEGGLVADIDALAEAVSDAADATTDWQFESADSPPLDTDPCGTAVASVDG